MKTLCLHIFLRSSNICFFIYSLVRVYLLGELRNRTIFSFKWICIILVKRQCFSPFRASAVCLSSFVKIFGHSDI